MLDLDSFKTTVKIKYKGKEYNVPKVREYEKDIVKTVSNSEDGDLSVFDKVMDFLIDRFSEIEGFPVEQFKQEATMDMVTAIFQALMGDEKKS